MVSKNRQEIVNFSNPDGSRLDVGEYTGIIKAEEWTELSEVEGVRFRTWKYEEVDAEIVDGALIEINPGCRTPVQFVETDHIFEEIVQSGEFLLIHLGPEGLLVYGYDSSEEISFTMQAVKGEIMCLYALKKNDKPGEVIEYERPGFSSAKLTSVEKETREIGGLIIPAEFWKLIEMLDSGLENDLPVDVFDLQEEI